MNTFESQSSDIFKALRIIVFGFVSGLVTYDKVMPMHDVLELMYSFFNITVASWYSFSDSALAEYYAWYAIMILFLFIAFSPFVAVVWFAVKVLNPQLLPRNSTFAKGIEFTIGVSFICFLASLIFEFSN